RVIGNEISLVQLFEGQVEIETEVYEYEGDKLVDFHSTREFQGYIQYNSELIIRIGGCYPADPCYTFESTYDQMDRMILRIQPEFECGISYEYDDSSNILISTYDSCEDITSTYTYDDKINPYSQRFTLAFEKLYERYFVPNNPLEIIATGDQEYTRTYQYTYNAQNYPTYHELYENGQLIETQTYTYE
ncbi:MAG: hypothetical protein AAFP76_17660, partial [Bacteroidota bacterium]